MLVRDNVPTSTRACGDLDSSEQLEVSAMQYNDATQLCADSLRTRAFKKKGTADRDRCIQLGFQEADTLQPGRWASHWHSMDPISQHDYQTANE